MARQCACGSYSWTVTFNGDGAPVSICCARCDTHAPRSDPAPPHPTDEEE